MSASSSHVMTNEPADPSFNTRTLPTIMLRNIGIMALKMGPGSTIHVSMGSQIVGYQHELYVDSEEIKWFCEMQQITPTTTIVVHIR